MILLHLNAIVEEISALNFSISWAVQQYPDSKLRFRRDEPIAGHRQRPSGEGGNQRELGLLVEVVPLMHLVWVWVTDIQDI